MQELSPVGQKMSKSHRIGCSWLTKYNPPPEIENCFGTPDLSIPRIPPPLAELKIVREDLSLCTELVHVKTTHCIPSRLGSLNQTLKISKL